MAIARGSKSVLLFKEESAYNTAPSGNWNQAPFNSESLDENIGNIQGEDIRPDRANPVLRGGNIAVGGSFTHDFGYGRMYTFMKHLLGAAGADSSPTTNAIAQSTAYYRGDYVTGESTHVWVCTKGGTTNSGVAPTDLPAATVTGVEVTVAGATSTTLKFMRAFASGTAVRAITLVPSTTGAFLSPGLSMEKQVRGGTADLLLQYTGGRVNSLDLSVPQQGLVKATWNMLFSTSTKLGATGGGTPTLFAEDPYIGFNSFVHVNESTTFQGATARAHRDFSLSITNQFIEDVYIVGSRFRFDLPEGTRRASGRLSMYFENSTEYDIFKNETEISLALSMVCMGYFVRFSFPEVKLTGSGSPKIAGSGPVTAEFDWTSYKQDATDDLTILIKGDKQIAGLPA